MFDLYVVIFFLWTAIALYLLLGGADFGVGIAELFSNKKNQEQIHKIMYREMGPVWEANHMWLIIVIVILFVGFPQIYSTLSTYLHIPLLIMLLGIIARGTAFTFRHYDAVIDNWHKVYNKIFIYSSFITPFFLGIIAAATVSGTINTEASEFSTAYIWSWLTPFGITLGIFTSCICGYLACSYTISQIENEEEKNYIGKKVKIFLISVILSGGLVFACAGYQKLPLISWIYGGVVGWTAVFFATLSAIGTFYYINKKKYSVIRILAGFQVIMILLAVTYGHYPDLVLLKQGSLSLLSGENEPKTIKMLAWVLILGSIFILPGVFHLIYSFQKKKIIECC